MDGKGMIKKVRIIFNDDGSDSYQVDEEEMEFGDITETVEEVGGALVREGVKVSLSPLRPDNLDEFIRKMRSCDDDMIFNLCEGAFGQSDLEMNVAAMLELFDLKFTGSGPVALALALDKGRTKDILRGRGVPTADYRVVEKAPPDDCEALGFPLIVKPLKEDASIGIEIGAVVKDAAELEKRVNYVVTEYYQPAIVEEYIEGREFNISVVGNGEGARTLPLSEIDFSDYPEGLPRIVSYEAKWITVSPLYIKTPPVCPADVPEELRGELERVALGAYRAIGCRDYARVDMRVGGDGGIRVLEVNPNPDISRDAGLARAAKSTGLDYHQLIKEIVMAAEARYNEPGAEEELTPPTTEETPQA
ncbi:MAG: ATP-grasp domain-containing protein [Thermodesulfobacteriota bacterium]